MEKNEDKTYTFQDFKGLETYAQLLQERLNAGGEWFNPLLQARRKEIPVRCPECGKKHCYVNRENGLFHCWSCDLHGRLEGYGQHQTPKKQRRAPKGKNEVPLLPTDYAPVDPKHLKECWEVYEPVSMLGDKPQYNYAQTAAQKYLAALQISPATARLAGLRCGRFYVDQNKTKNDEPDNCLIYATHLNGKIINLKMRTVDHDNEGKLKKGFQQDHPNKHAAPYNIDCINPAREPQACEEGKDTLLIITEGEKDVLTLLECGFPKVISVPDGAMSDLKDCFEAFYDWLQEAGSIVICGDSDHPGRVLQKNLTDYFGGNVSIVKLPQDCKDISDVYALHGRQEVERCIAMAQRQENPDILRVSSISQEVLKVCMGEYDHGYSIGYGPYTDRHLWLTDEGGLIVVTGRPNEGKTDWMRCTLAHLMLQHGKGVVFCSFEEHIKEKHIRRLVQLMYGCRKTEQIPQETLCEGIGQLDGLMAHLVMARKQPTARNILRLTEECIYSHDLPVGFLIIDPYLFVQSEQPSESETQQIKRILTTLQAWGREHRVWVIMVAHPRKLMKDGTSEYEEIDEYTIAGSAHWANLADFLLSVKRVSPYGKTRSERTSEDPTYTEVTVLKVRDQDLCSTGRLYFMRQPCGRYDERLDADACKREIEGLAPQAGEHRVTDTQFWV